MAAKLNRFGIFSASFFKVNNQSVIIHIGTREYFQPLSNQDIKTWKLWPDLMTEDDQKNGEVVYGFKQAMDSIWKNQHPPDCSKAKYLIANGFVSGFGSEIHVVGVGLALAMNMNRVFIMDPAGPKATDFLNNTWQTRTPFCSDQNKITLECYFEPWTHCSINDAFDGDIKTVDDLRVLGKTYISDTDLHNNHIIDSPYKAILLESRADVPLVVPAQFENIYRCAPFDTHFNFYWWRAVSTAYLLRPSEPTLKKFQELGTLNLNKAQEQCISIYVRRGDKHVEMELVPFMNYANAAKVLWEEGLVPGPASPALPGVVFLGTEDPSVLDEALVWSKANNWKVQYTNLFDRRAVSAGLNFSEQQELKKSNAFVHHDLEYFSMLLNIDYHLKCRGFVCTMASNFCRVIDELRATVGGKANRHYVDVSASAGCGNYPCVDTNFQLVWR